ncbi:hypothetical protein ALC56_12695 [Trachymyrmex septentrionalis]|uniref:Odorant receptor 13a n=1 Tax=Trachymyrmex septentrionalis TaxID=34720 RepID=A0A195EY35_9HYME|nr:hypothetical protein ALC56_12695 [Trachymyrmex septentrionalis]
MSYTHHACGLFEIASYRIEQTLFENTMQDIASSSKRSSIMCQGVINGFNMYRKAIEFLSWLIASKKYYEMIVSFLFVFGHFGYNVQWYVAPVRAQKLLLLMMQRSMRHCTIVVNGLFIPSFEGFATVKFGMSISYFALTTFITTEYNIDILLQVLAHSISWLGYTLKYNILCLNIRRVRDLMQRILYDWNELNNLQEIKIIKEYADIGRFITLIVTLFIYVCLFCGILILFLSNFFLNITSDKNESRPRQLPILVECFIDQQKYFFLILFFLCFAAVCAFTVIAATETIIMCYIHHACGLFEIARFIEMFKRNYILAYSVLLPFGVLSLSINLYHLSRLIASKKYYDIIINVLFVIGHFWNMFFGNYFGQKVIDHSSNVFYRIYNVQWYIAPLRAQKLLLLMMQRSMRHCTIILTGLFIPSLEGFATLTTFITTEYNVDVLLHVLAYSIPWLGYMLKYSTVCLNIRMRDLMKRILCDWNELNNLQEIKIIKKYADIGRFITLIATLFIYVSIFCFILVLFLSNFFINTTSDKNESRPRQLPILVECFIDQQKYFFLILFLIFFAATCGLTTVAATETVNMSYIHHACGLFEIASINLYRLIISKKYYEIIINFLFVSGHFWHMFFCNYLGQKVIDHSSDVFHRIYNVQWYVAPLRVQKLLLLMMQRSMRHCTIVINGLFIPSFEGFANTNTIASCRNKKMKTYGKNENLHISHRQNSLKCCGNMVFAGNRYYKINQILLTCTGLWPYYTQRFCEYLMAEDIYAMSISFLYIVTHFCYMFFVNYIGQQVIDYSSNIFKKTYNSRWYAAPLNTQKCFIIITYRSMKTYTLTIHLGLFVPSLEGFATVNYYLSFDLRNSSRNLRSLSAFSAGLVKYALFHRKPPSSYPLCNKCAVVLFIVSFDTLKKGKGKEIPKELLLKSRAPTKVERVQYKGVSKLVTCASASVTICRAVQSSTKLPLQVAQKHARASHNQVYNVSPLI